MNVATAKKFDIGIHSVIHVDDCAVLLAGMPPASVHLVVTSPPYHDRKAYGDGPDERDLGRPQGYAEFLDGMATVWNLCNRALVPGGKLVFVSANMKTRETQPPRLEPIHHDLVQAAITAGFVYYDEIIWMKKASYTGSISGRPLFGSYPYPGNPKMLNQLWESIAVMHKTGTRPRNYTPEQKEQSKLTWEQWRQWTHGVWRIESVSDPAHPATFNQELAERIIRLYSYQGETVLDPFAGIGSAIIAAESTGRIGVGCELRPEYAKTAASRATNLRQLPLL